MRLRGMGRAALLAISVIVAITAADARAEAPPPPPDVAVTGASGAEGRLSDYRGELLVVNFWATWCPPCKREMPDLDDLAAALEGRGARVLTVSTDIRRELAVAYLADEGFDNLPPLHDADGKLTQAFGLRGMPTTYLIDAEGGVFGKVEGAAPWADAEVVAWIEALAAE